jgi:hypothetical protein
MQLASMMAETIYRLPAIIYQQGAPPLLQQAAAESFFVNVRALVEFLDGRAAKKGDKWAHDVLTTWSPPTKVGPEAATWTKLNLHWFTATKNLVHFAAERVQQEPDGTPVWVPVEQHDLEAVADDVLSVWDELANQVNHRLMWRRGAPGYWHPDGTSDGQGGRAAT